MTFETISKQKALVVILGVRESALDVLCNQGCLTCPDLTALVFQLEELRLGDVTEDMADRHAKRFAEIMTRTRITDPETSRIARDAVALVANGHNGH